MCLQVAISKVNSESYGANAMQFYGGKANDKGRLPIRKSMLSDGSYQCVDVVNCDVRRDDRNF
ncbi:hypothetical protein SV7mr_50850 [Stieleria bergensis]|uniref:Uncharacterized protein n=1 Tax=Stieleria bergensis TaxID=2528025 RepID=A0A517T2C2_9BACT|nr:hypothetical protein SV7mr_50850 [Planctomycetes bacterium SV_7m_r]